MATTHDPSVLIAMMTKSGLRKNADGQSFRLDEIGNGLYITTPVVEGDPFEIPFYVLAVGGKAGRSLRLGIAVEYPDGVRAGFSPQDAAKVTKTQHGAVEWFAGIVVPFRMTGVHWVRVALNSAFKTEAPVNVQRSGEAVSTVEGLFQA